MCDCTSIYSINVITPIVNLRTLDIVYFILNLPLNRQTLLVQVVEHGDAISVMRTLKMALDPDNIMNPGKVIQV